MNSGDNSHLVVVPAGTILSDNLYNTPLFQGEGHAGFAGAEAGNAPSGDVSLSALYDLRERGSIPARCKLTVFLSSNSLPTYLSSAVNIQASGLLVAYVCLLDLALALIPRACVKEMGLELFTSKSIIFQGNRHIYLRQARFDTFKRGVSESGDPCLILLRLE